MLLLCTGRIKTNTMFTFKTEKSTGKWRSFYPDHHYIKLKNGKVGSIDDNFPHKIRLAVFKDDINEDGNPNCQWRWITLKKESQSVSEAKAWINGAYKSIVDKYKLFPLDV